MTFARAVAILAARTASLSSSREPRKSSRRPVGRGGVSDVMATIVASQAAARHLVISDERPSRDVQSSDITKKRMAKAAVRKSDTAHEVDVRKSDITPEQIGRALAAAFGSLDLNSQQASDELEENDAEVGKWL